mgnify:CR=1 FL=1
MKKILLSFALIIGLLTSASTAMAQTVNMSRYITLTVSKDSAIRLDFGAAAYGTSVRIVSGRNTYNITVGPVWYDGNDPSTYTVTAGASTITVYGDIIGFDCSNNGANLTALDPSHNTELRLLSCHSNQLTSLDVSNNTQLTILDFSHNNLNSLDVSKNTQLTNLYCWGNKFTTAALDAIYCALPAKISSDGARIFPLNGSSSAAEQNMVASTNAANATTKNWKVLKFKEDGNHTDIATTGSYVCSGGGGKPNMNSYITLTVAKDSAIRLDFKAAAANTSVRIVSGSNTQDITVGTNWTGTVSYTTGSTTMTIYGDITRFDCSGNGANLTAIDPSHNTQLTKLVCSNNRLTSLDVSKNTELEGLNCANNKLNSLDISKNTQLEELYCHSNQLTSLDVSKNTQLEKLWCQNNNLTTLDVSKNTQLEELFCSDNKFTTATLDDIYCALPDRRGDTNGKIQPVHNSSSSNHATVLATNAQNAIAKNWKVQYYQNDTDIPTTTGTYTCPQLNMSSYITLTVKSGEDIKLDFKAAAAGTPVRIVSGSNTQDIRVGTSWTGFSSYTADGTKMTVYGDLIRFDCSGNGANLTAIDPSHNTQLEMLYCYSNTLSSLDVSQNTQLTLLSCKNNNLTTLDVNECTQLKVLNCSFNKLSSLHVSKNTQLTELYCYDNNFTTATLDDIYCALPDRNDSTKAGVIQPVYSDTSSNHATVLATNAANAITKNWKVQYYDGNVDITTTGKHKCSATDIADASAEPALTLYPNPVADVLYLSATARTIRIYNIYGIEVAHATDTDRIDVASLPAGVYTVKADGTVAKMVKR